MKGITVISLLLCLFSFSYGQQFKRQIQFLSSDSLRGRAPGTIQEKEAASYIVSQLRQYHHIKTTYQFFHFAADSSCLNDTAQNVIGLINRKKNKTIIICAHYDHLGIRSTKSREIRANAAFHPGADDNASGVAIALELAKWLSLQKKWPCNFLFLFTSAHELGLYGVKHFVGSNFIQKQNVKAVLNLDMVGRLDPSAKSLKISASDTATLFFQTANITGLNLRFDNEIDNDFTVFKKAGFRTYSFTTGTHDDYHKITDTPDKINYAGLKEIEEFMERVLQSFSKQ